MTHRLATILHVTDDRRTQHCTNSATVSRPYRRLKIKNKQNMQSERKSTQVCSALWQTTVDKVIKLTPSHLLLYVNNLFVPKIITFCRCTHLLQAKM